MFAVGPFEIFVIFVVALLVLGPEKLPEVARMLAKVIRDVQRYADEMRREFHEQTRLLESEDLFPPEDPPRPKVPKPITAKEPKPPDTEAIDNIYREAEKDSYVSLTKEQQGVEQNKAEEPSTASDSSEKKDEK